MAITRTDVHRPSEIEPMNYEFVGFRCPSMAYEDAMFDAHYRQIIENHREMTGGQYSDHEHGGNCHICGAHCIYIAVFYYSPENTYIITGLDCAEKLEMNDDFAKNAFRKKVTDHRNYLKGKKKAKVLLQDAGLERAWEYKQYESVSYKEDETHPLSTLSTITENAGIHSHFLKTFFTICSIVTTVEKKGFLSDNMFDYLNSLVERMDTMEEKVAEWIEREENRASVPDTDERVKVKGKVISFKWNDTAFGLTQKMLVEAESGYKVFGTVPSKLGNLNRGDIVEFTAKLTRSDNDRTFGFFNRPTKAQIVSKKETA